MKLWLYPVRWKFRQWFSGCYRTRLISWLSKGQPLVMNCNVNIEGIKPGWALFSNKPEQKSILSPIVHDAPAILIGVVKE